MSEVIKGDAAILEGLAGFCASQADIRHTEDKFGNAFHWFKLESPDSLVNAAKMLQPAGARLAMITAYNAHHEKGPMHNACYEFVLGGVVYSLTIQMDEEHPAAPSITPYFANADWHEREMMELYGIRIKGHPDPKRLFLDEELDKGLLGQLVPLSVVMNGASSTDLWERILASREYKS